MRARSSSIFAIVLASGYRGCGASAGLEGVAAGRAARSGAGAAAGAEDAVFAAGGGGGGVDATFFAQPAPKPHNAAIETTPINSRKVVIICSLLYSIVAAAA